MHILELETGTSWGILATVIACMLGLIATWIAARVSNTRRIERMVSELGAMVRTGPIDVDGLSRAPAKVRILFEQGLNIVPGTRYGTPDVNREFNSEAQCPSLPVLSPLRCSAMARSTRFAGLPSEAPDRQDLTGTAYPVAEFPATRRLTIPRTGCIIMPLRSQSNESKSSRKKE